MINAILLKFVRLDACGDPVSTGINPEFWQKPTIFRGLKYLKSIVQTTQMWISRDYLWISAFGCGEVVQPGKSPLNAHPHIWTRVSGTSKIWIGLRYDVFCG